MNSEELRTFVATLGAIESIALLDSVSSTNDLARRVIAECVDNEVRMGNAIIVAREQRSGRGRGANHWLSPSGGGIYATAIIVRDKEAIALLPLEVANALSRFLSDTFGVDARIKWPNDVLIADRKAAGILIEARFDDSVAHLAIGIGVNIRNVGPMFPHAISIEEASGTSIDLADATRKFITALDAFLASPPTSHATLHEWRRRTIHQPGERVNVSLGSQRVDAEWIDIDLDGRASVRTAMGIVQIAAGDLIRVE